MQIIEMISVNIDAIAVILYMVIISVGFFHATYKRMITQRDLDASQTENEKLEGKLKDANGKVLKYVGFITSSEDHLESLLNTLSRNYHAARTKQERGKLFTAWVIAYKAALPLIDIHPTLVPSTDFDTVAKFVGAGNKYVDWDWFKNEESEL